MKQNLKQNKVHEEEIIVAKLRSDKNRLPVWIKRTISLWTAMEVSDVYRVQKTEYQITIKQMQILRFFYFYDDFQNV